MSDEESSSKPPKVPFTELTFAYWILRLWIGFRLLLSGIAKFKVRGENEYALSAYEGATDSVSDLIWENTILPEAVTRPFAFTLGPLLIIFGITVLIGLFNRLSLLVAGFLFISLSLGLMLLPDDEYALSLGIHVAIVAGALCLVKHNRIALTRW